MKGSLVRVRVSALSICGDLFGEQADDSSAWRLRVYPVSTTSRDEALAEPSVMVMRRPSRGVTHDVRAGAGR